MEKCRFLNEYGHCNALSISDLDCSVCNFYQTNEEWRCKEEKVKEWYKGRGMSYDTVLFNMKERDK